MPEAVPVLPQHLPGVVVARVMKDLLGQPDLHKLASPNAKLRDCVFLMDLGSIVCRAG